MKDYIPKSLLDNELEAYEYIRNIADELLAKSYRKLIVDTDISKLYKIYEYLNKGKKVKKHRPLINVPKNFNTEKEIYYQLYN